ncbi:hypothetical protein SARC_02384 [Sphaeroforma arctica JP610]|uniref:Uncharacterized protein n=1 Tax=Sphaeroforma arctica JP610 TaxID=667725 RepID=A0A0L0G949_9EUKA|nr:hypothetical protein SARC_02384 [Sphaeroforma arctica JP610]KNC85434.1 hypothetical protein SARC_02384 [Sphaeroforma arctica JP610]|eukprot:XP_014159336.1 hypothetical protein SARC_02384 [Sphaeroforma arctica JP610]
MNHALRRHAGPVRAGSRRALYIPVGMSVQDQVSVARRYMNKAEYTLLSFRTGSLCAMTSGWIMMAYETVELLCTQCKPSPLSSLLSLARSITHFQSTSVTIAAVSHDYKCTTISFVCAIAIRSRDYAD